MCKLMLSTATVVPKRLVTFTRAISPDCVIGNRSPLLYSMALPDRRSVWTLLGTAALDHGKRRQCRGNHHKRHDRGERPKGIERWRSDVRGHRPDLQRQGITGTYRQQGACKLVVGQRKAEQRHSNDAR